MNNLGEKLAADLDQTSIERVWLAVITDAIQEWMHGPLSKSRLAEQYLFSDQKDFPLVCNSAGLDVDNLRARLEKLRGQVHRGMPVAA